MTRTVVVEQEYNPDIMDASKVNVLPKVEEPTVSKKEVEYATTFFPATSVPAGLMRPYVFDQGDDAVVIKAGRNQDAWRLNTPCENIVIRHCDILKLCIRDSPDAYKKGVPLGTQSQWGWHSFANMDGYRHEETLSEYDCGRGHKELYAVQSQEDKRQKNASDWFRANPHRLHLGVIGFEWGDEAAISDAVSYTHLYLFLPERKKLKYW